MGRRLASIGTVLLILTLTAPAGGIGTAFLAVPSNPRELALGGLTASVAGDPSLFRGNPALIAQSIPASELFLSYNSWFAGVSGSSMLMVEPLLRGTFGFGVRHLGVSDLEFRTTTPTDDYLSKFSASGTAIESTWGRDFGQLRVGATLRWIRTETYIYTSTGFGVDAGVWVPLAQRRISLGASVLNVGSMNRLMRESPAVPTTALAGITFDTKALMGLSTDRIRSSMSVAVEASRVHGWVTRIAGEVFFSPLRFTLGTRLSAEVTAVAAGFGLRWRRFQLGYGIEVGSTQLGIPHLFRLRVTLP